MKLPVFLPDSKKSFLLIFDLILIASIVFFLISEFALKYIFTSSHLIYVVGIILAGLTMVGLIPVGISAVRAIVKRHITIDLLATIALVFSLVLHEWTSAAFITLMLTFARVFEHITDARMERTIKGLMKYHVEWVRTKVGDNIKDVHISEIRSGDIVIVESGENVPVDGVIISGQADINESSLTGESELVPKREGDKVFTSTINESGSIIVKTEKIGADTTLAKIIKLVEESSREKNEAEMAADRFSERYILVVFVSSVALYWFGIDPKIILALLLVVCADDIAVAVPLTYTAAIAYAARRGVLIKGSGALEQLSRMNYILTDKTGTLTKGRPKVATIKNYGKLSFDDVCKRFASGASESKHAVSKAIIAYAKEHNIKPHVPDEFGEIPGEGVTFVHNGEMMFMGRVSYTERQSHQINVDLKNDIEAEKNVGRGIVLLSVNEEVVGLLSYIDELRPNISEIIRETRQLGINEWHMLTGDNERAASAIAHSLNIRHFHANMTPESKVEFIRNFEKEHGPKATKQKGVVGYIGDGVNDAAPLALADVSIAMGGIGSDAAIEAADITIMKDNLNRVPEIIRISRKVRSVMRGNFWIWAVTNSVGLLLVVIGIPGFGHLGPAGAATYNFLTDFFPILNAFRAGRK
ncbi:MAG: cation-translocating P-type ATPase [Candidatus Taylorbacteria bacterium]